MIHRSAWGGKDPRADHDAYDQRQAIPVTKIPSELLRWGRCQGSGWGWGQEERIPINFHPNYFTPHSPKSNSRLKESDCLFKIEMCNGCWKK
jgi:hypothetical protein